MFQIISNNADHFIEHIPSASTPDPKNPNPNLLQLKNDTYLSPSEMKVLNLNDNEHDDGKITEQFMNASVKLSDEIEAIVVTPKKHKRFNKENCDGIVLTRNEDNEFLEPTNMSPILENNQTATTAGVDGLQNIQEEEDEDGDQIDYVENTMDAMMTKRKRDSFDNISMISIDSLAPPFNSAKKPKLIRTGSITRTLRRSMSFVAMKNPISNMIRSRRNSVDPNASISSITSIESTFNESIKRPVKDKLRNLKDRIMKNGNGSRKEFCLTPKTPKTTKKIMCSLINTTERCESPDNVDASFVADPFKTPLAPPRSSVMMSAPKSLQYQTGECDNIRNLTSHPLNNSTMLQPSITCKMDAIVKSETMINASDSTIETPSKPQQDDEMCPETSIQHEGNAQDVPLQIIAQQHDQMAVLILICLIVF